MDNDLEPLNPEWDGFENALESYIDSGITQGLQVGYQGDVGAASLVFPTTNPVLAKSMLIDAIQNIYGFSPNALQDYDTSKGIVVDLASLLDYPYP